MDIIGIGYMGFETANLDAWREYGPQVMGFGIGKSPESDPQSLYFRIDDRRHRFAFHPGKVTAWPTSAGRRSGAWRLRTV